MLQSLWRYIDRPAVDQTLCSDNSRASSTIASDDDLVPIGSTTTDTDYQWSQPYRQDRSRSQYEKRISELEQKLFEVVASEARKKKALERKDREIQGLQAQLEEQENQIRDMQDTLNDMREEAEELDNELDQERRCRVAGQVRIRELEERAHVSNNYSRSTYQSRATSRVGNIFQVPLDNTSLSQTASSAHATQRRAENPLRLDRSQIQRLQTRPSPSSRSSLSGTLVGSDSGNSEVTAVEPTRRMEPVLYRGSEILWRGYGVPKNTPVPACTASDGYHHFSGKGTNGYKTRYTCTICHFVCSESRR